MRGLIAGNWKMNGSRDTVAELLEGVKKEVEGVDLAVFPPYVFLSETQSILKDSAVKWGAQNVSEHEKGAYTGEVSLSMLKDFGCEYVLLGHSECRQYYGETDAVVAAKYSAVKAYSGITPIVCVGETEAEREADRTETVIARQLQAILEQADASALQNTVIAYEPVWAIGTGKTASPEQAQDVHAFIRDALGKVDKGIASGVRILYGGSVKPDNAEAIFAMPDINGGLIGGASLKAESFLEVANAWSS